MYQVLIEREMTKTIPLVNLISFWFNYINNNQFNDTNHAWQCKDEFNTNIVFGANGPVQLFCWAKRNVFLHRIFKLNSHLMRIWFASFSNSHAKFIISNQFQFSNFRTIEKFIRYLKNWIEYLKLYNQITLNA